MAQLKDACHELFAQVWHKTENKSEAYRSAYPEKAAKWKDETLHNKASELSRKSEVMARYDELKQETADNHGITIATLLAELDAIKVIAMAAETPQCSAAVSSVMSKAKLCGLDVVKLEVVSNETLTPWNIINVLVDE